MGTHHLLKSIVGTSRAITSWIQPVEVLFRAFCEPQMPTTFRLGVSLEDPNTAQRGEEAEFCWPF